MSKKVKKNLLVVDASSFLYRAFHAMPDLRNKKNFPTGAITGMINMLQKTREEWPAEIGLCVFDPKGPTFREELFSEYKANRSKMPDDLSKQTTVILEIIEALGWPSLTIPGYEADDVIGTINFQAPDEGSGSDAILVCAGIEAVSEGDFVRVYHRHLWMK